MQMITQTQIRAYEQCPRFYYLKMIRSLAWPVENTSRVKMKQGEDFHLLVRQLILGLPAESLLIPAGEPSVSQWLEAFLAYQPLRDFDTVYVEKEVSTLFNGVLWLGKFDALAIKDDRLTIFDWKTTGRNTDRSAYLRSPQTRLYRFLAKQCGPRLFGAGLHEFPAENIEMIYWFPEHPDQPIRLPYSEAAFQEDQTYLKTRSLEMSSANEADYPPKQEQSRQCAYCDYRTYCFPSSGSAAGDDFSAGEEGFSEEDDGFYQGSFLFPDPFPETGPDSETSY